MSGRHSVNQFDTNGRPILPNSQQVLHGQITNIQNIPGTQQSSMSLPSNAIMPGLPNQSGMLRHSVQNPIEVIRPGTTVPVSIRQPANNRSQNALNPEVLIGSGAQQMIPLLTDNTTNNVQSRPPTQMPSVNQIHGRPHNIASGTTIKQPVVSNFNSANRPPPAGKILPRNIQRPKMFEMPKPQLTLKAEYIITPSSIVGKKKLSVMRIRGQKVDLTKLNAPVKLHRRDPEAPTQNGGINNRQNQSIVPGNKSAQVLPPTTGTADASLIAPYAGARQNKKNLFKKKTTQVFLADPKSRELRAEESIPWVLEDFGGENTFIGDYIGGDSAKYCVLLKKGDKFRFVPVHRFYEFQRKLKIRTLTIEEAEEQMARAKKMDNDRWLMRRFGKGKEAEDNEGGIYDPKSSIKTDLPDDANPLIDDETKEVGKLKAKAKRPFELNDPSLSDEGDELTTEGKQMKKLIRELDDNDVYESDRESNPYFSESDEFDSEGTSSPSSKSPSTAGSGNKTVQSAKTEKLVDKGKVTTIKSKATNKPTTTKSKMPTGTKIKGMAEKQTKLKTTTKQKPVVPKPPANKGKSATPVSANVTTSVGSKIKVPEKNIRQVSDITYKASDKGISSATSVPGKGAIQKQKPTKIGAPSSSSSSFAATPVSAGRSKETSPNLGKRSLSNDSESISIKRARVDAPTEAKKLVKPPIKREEEGRPGPSGSAVNNVKKSKAPTKGSTGNSQQGSLIDESEIRNLILTRKVRVTDLILSFKNRIKEDSRNKDRLLSITKEIATYKDGILVLKGSS
ncbi:9186_t:CDS:2 [Acaulospora morrowiae]|uniref:Transcription initiation factor IIF subunit alpha n=1 Tax=Acaulospora morrowiae TaxID=94023 RepID=A0A9N9FYP4_9GLOM|nr:9186_t:CDS:2 [Acaulospora morrowiae]